jgi:hypothetical protein
LFGMSPTFAEVARTLARGRLPGLIRVAGWAQPLAVQHATDCAGRPMVLARSGGDLSRALGAVDGRKRVAALLSVDDRPPVDGAPALGRVRIGGRVHRLDADEAAPARLEFAEANPVSELLDVGRGVTLFAIEVDRVQVQRGVTIEEVDVEAFIEADPDPLHEVEQDLLLDLAGHHSVEVERHLRQALGFAGVPGRGTPKAVRLDRYGFTVDSGRSPKEPWYRLEFTRPVRDRHELARVLHPVLFPQCHGHCRNQSKE